jgi:hypothetical protein
METATVDGITVLVDPTIERIDDDLSPQQKRLVALARVVVGRDGRLIKDNPGTTQVVVKGMWWWKRTVVTLRDGTVVKVRVRP